MIARPSILLADEPTGNVDDKMGERLMYLFVELNKIGTTIVIATHDFGLAERVNAPILDIDDGKLSICRRPRLSSRRCVSPMAAASGDAGARKRRARRDG